MSKLKLSAVCPDCKNKTVLTATKPNSLTKSKVSFNCPKCCGMFVVFVAKNPEDFKLVNVTIFRSKDLHTEISEEVVSEGTEGR